jgi:hypothetical protein
MPLRGFKLHHYPFVSSLDKERAFNVRSPPQDVPVCRLLEMKELHRILHRLPASGTYCGLLAVFGWFAGSD